MVIAAALLAHQGGWDEILLIGAPIVAIGLLLRVAKKRVDGLQQAATAEDRATGATADAADADADDDAADADADPRSSDASDLRAE